MPALPLIEFKQWNIIWIFACCMLRSVTMAKMESQSRRQRPKQRRNQGEACNEMPARGMWHRQKKNSMYKKERGHSPLLSDVVGAVSAPGASRRHRHHTTSSLPCTTPKGISRQNAKNVFTTKATRRVSLIAVAPDVAAAAAAACCCRRRCRCCCCCGFCCP